MDRRSALNQVPSAAAPRTTRAQPSPHRDPAKRHLRRGNALPLAAALIHRLLTYYLPPVWGFWALRWLGRHGFV
jgi:hypothetical protein